MQDLVAVFVALASAVSVALLTWLLRLQREINRHQIVINGLNHARISRLEEVVFATKIESASGSPAETVH